MAKCLSEHEAEEAIDGGKCCMNVVEITEIVLYIIR